MICHVMRHLASMNKLSFLIASFHRLGQSVHFYDRSGSDGRWRSTMTALTGVAGFTICSARKYDHMNSIADIQVK